MFFFFQAEDGIRDRNVTGVQTCALPISAASEPKGARSAADPLRLTERLSARTLLIGGVLTIVLVLLIGVEQDPDFWWHLRVGRWMAEHGRLPSQDLFTFTVPTHVWTDHESLTEMLMWLTYS